MFRKILVANRGEIALRIMRTCREMGIATVAVYSRSDSRSPHARYSDEAVLLEGKTLQDTYLNITKLLEAARERQADAIHPGYGFLSENVHFAEKCVENGFVFIGPDAAAIREMGDKMRARKLVREAGVPVPPGSGSGIRNPADAGRIASRIGYPVLVKAAAGGGGRGMRKVDREEDLHAALKAAQSESAAAFGDNRIYMEKYLEEPRHIEFQIFGDHHGNLIHLFERECSIQRRHQKLVEESPSPFLNDRLRAEMGEAALQAARSCGYTGAGTVEFLVDRNGTFYFLEMNTRLQVEHPVTELVTGLDLVALQIRVAGGNPLGMKQEDISSWGHAIECRVCAENPFENFLPAVGNIDAWRPATGPGIRVDEGICTGMAITTEYDSLLAKIIVHGSDRQHAISRAKRALDDTVVTGCHTTIPFCRFVMDHPVFCEGAYDTHFVSDYFKADVMTNQVLQQPEAIVAGLLEISTSDGDWNRDMPVPEKNQTGSVRGQPGGRLHNQGLLAGSWWQNRKNHP